MGEVTFKIRQGQEDLTVVHYESPLNVAQAKQALMEEDTSWVGALQEEGSSRRLAGDQPLKAGSSYILTLQRQSGECYFALVYLLAYGYYSITRGSCHTTAAVQNHHSLLALFVA